MTTKDRSIPAWEYAAIYFLMWVFLCALVLAPASYFLGGPWQFTTASASCAVTLLIIGFGERRWFWISRFMDSISPRK